MISEDIKIPIDLTNPGHFFACCGLLELAGRLWPEVDGWFKSAGQFVLSTGGRATSMAPLCKAVIESQFAPLLPDDELNYLTELNRRKADCKKRKKAFPKNEETIRKCLNSKRIGSGFGLGPPLNLRVDWWRVENCDADHLKTWAGQQAVSEIAAAMKAGLPVVADDALFDTDIVLHRQNGGDTVAPLSFDAGRVGTAQDIGYSPDDIGQALTCSVWTEFLTLVALQRFALRPDSTDVFTFHVWRKPLPAIVAAVASQGMVPQLIACQGRFRLAGRDVGNRYKAFQQATLTEWRLV
jgi:CRISPR-associated protein Csb3